jgi:PhnB protein
LRPPRPHDHWRCASDGKRRISAAFSTHAQQYLSLAVDSTEEAERIYALLSDGGEIFMKLEETFFAHRSSMLRDKFGTSWMIAHQRPMPGDN